jgi:hypothetical protein
MPNFYRRGQGVEISDVQGFVQQLEQRQDNQARFVQHDKDEKLWRLEPYTLEEVSVFKTDSRKWPSLTLNGPRTYWNAVRKATSAPPRFRVLLPGLSLDPLDEEGYTRGLGETARHERFALGLFHALDEQRLRRAMMPFQRDLSFFMAIRGGAIPRIWYNPDARQPFRIDLWDPRTVVYEPGGDGLSFASHHYWTPRYDLIDRYADVNPDELTGDANDNCEVFDAWWLEGGSVFNAVFTPSTVLLKPEEMPIDHVPVYVVRAFGPDSEGNYEEQGNAARRTTDAWESIYAANREMYAALNRIATLYSLYLRWHAIGPYQVDPASTTIRDQSDFQKALEPFGIFPGKIGPVSPPEMANEVKELFGHVQGAEQRGSIPYSVYGQIPFELSGFAVNQLQGAVGIVAGPLVDQMKWVFRLVVDECIQQFRARGQRKSVSLRGTDGRRQQFMEEIRRADLRDKYFFDVDLDPELPVDKLQEAQIAQAWASLGIDPITVMDEILKLDDPRQAMQRMAAWQLLQRELQLQVQAQTQAPAAGGNGARPPSEAMPPDMMGMVDRTQNSQGATGMPEGGPVYG